MDKSNNDTSSSPSPEATPRKKKKRQRFLLSPANIISQLLFIWVWKLIFRIQKIQDLKNINICLYSTETSSESGDLLQEKWNQEMKTPNASLKRALFHAFGYRYLFLIFWKVLWGLFTWVGVFWVLRELIQFQDDSSKSAFSGPTYVALLFISAFLGALCFHQLVFQSTRIGIQCRGALMVLIYKKSLKMRYIKGGVGDVVNLISNDCNRIAEGCVNAHYFWAAPLECVVIVVLTLYDIGIAAIPAFMLIICVLFPLQYFLARSASSISYETTSLITKRVRLMSEMLTAIKLIKFYAWEDYYLQKVNRARKTEVEKERKELMHKIAGFMLVFIAPVLAMLISIVSIRYINGFPVQAAQIFSLLLLFNTLRYPLLLLPSAERTITGAQISISRLEEYCKLPEIDDPVPVTKNESDPDILMSIQNASFKWDGDIDHPHINNITLELRKKQIIAVVGDVGSGKSLLAAILGQLKRVSGTVELHGTFGYMPQEPWLIDASIRDNIQFGADVEEAAYMNAIRICGLTRDLMLMSNGDDMFISELNLTPGQRQRISLARCVCRNSDIILMEDCLSDFDQSHAKRLFKECLKNELSKNKCIVMITQQKKILTQCDLVIVVKAGKVEAQGTYAELKARHVNFSAWVSDVTPIEDDPTGVLDRVNEIKLDTMYQTTPKYLNPLNPINSANNLLRPAFSGIPKKIKKPSPLATANVINATDEPTVPESLLEPNQTTIRQIIELNSGSTQINRIDEKTISKMIERSQAGVLSGNPSHPPPNFSNQDIVARTIEANQLTAHAIPSHTLPTLTETATMNRVPEPPSLFGSYFLYIREANWELLAWGIIIFFLILPSIRLASDAWLSIIVSGIYSSDVSIGVYGALCFAIAFGVLLRGYGFSYAVLTKNISFHNRVLKSVLRAPMSFYDVTPLGHILSFFARHLFLIDEFLPESALQVMTFGPVVVGTIILVSAVVPWFWATLPLYAFLGWLVMRNSQIAVDKLEQYEASNKSPLFAHLSTTLEGLFSVRLCNIEEKFDGYNRTLIDADHKALFSLLLVKSFVALYIDIIACIFIFLAAYFVVIFNVSAPVAGLALTNAIQLVLFVQWLVRMIGELHSSMNSVSAVVSFAKSIPKEYRDNDSSKMKPPENWPNRGEIEFKNITIRYHQYGVAVLKSVSFYIRPGEKIAIVGRSGSGKTTLLMSLMRMLEPVEGEITIDGILTSTIHLPVLRSRLAVIPQQPVMFQGTIRTNLDPFGNVSDDRIWEALKAVHLTEKIQELELKLETRVQENGKMFSQAERQLFCIARAIIIPTRIVVFDEPSVSVDNETDDLIRQVVKDNFADRTVIILANRFRLIVQMDRILVMSHGRVVEFDTPIALLDNPKSKFCLMVSQTGNVDPERLRKIALSQSDGHQKSFEIPHYHHENQTTRSFDSSSSIPRSLAEIFISPEMRRSKSGLSVSSQISASDRESVHHQELELKDLNAEYSTI